METLRGRTSLELDFNGLQARLTDYNHIALDLGTGDGRYVHDLARRHPDWFVIGVDSCRENLRDHSRAKLPNMLFVIASAQDLPREFSGLFSQITINFPWGSLLESLLTCDPDLMRGLAAIARRDARIGIHLNSGALAEAGRSLEAGTEEIYENLNRSGWDLKQPYSLDHAALRIFPTTWARRLAHGRDPRGMALTGARACT